MSEKAVSCVQAARGPLLVPQSQAPAGEAQPPTSELFRQVQAFQLVRATNDAEATPSGWQPGKPTLKVGPDLVGKVWTVWKTELAF